MKDQKYYKRTPWRKGGYFITEVTKTGETMPLRRRRGIKGYNFYKDMTVVKFLPLDKQEK